MQGKMGCRGDLKAKKQKYNGFLQIGRRAPAYDARLR
jgi:hypothetical protein